jgi:protein-S-isoprenylcysteine O-methyltransferase Ste14
VVDSVGVADKEKSFSQFWEDWVVFWRRRRRRRRKGQREKAPQLRFFFTILVSVFVLFFSSQTLQTFIHSWFCLGFAAVVISSNLFFFLALLLLLLFGISGFG